MSIIVLADLKTWLGISDTNDDANLTFAVNAANTAVTTYCGRTFDKINVGSETARIYAVTDPYVMRVHDFYDLTNLSVKTDDSDTGTFGAAWTINTDFIVEPLNGLDGSLPVPYHRIRAVNAKYFPVYNRRPSLQVTAAWGWSAVPADVITGTLIKAARIFKRKDSPEGVLGGFADMGVIRVTRHEDPDVCALVGPYRRPDIVAMIG